MKKFTLLAVGLYFIFLLSGCSSKSDKIIIGTAQDPNLAAQVIIAEEKEFFKEEGLDAEVKLFTSGADLVTAAASGDVQFASTGDIPTLNLRMNGANISVISKVSNIGGAQAILTSEDYINNPQSLKGKRIGVKRGTVGEMLINSYFTSIGFQPDEINIVEVVGADAITAFIRNDIDAFYTWEPFVIRAQEAGAKVLARARSVDGTNKTLVGIHAYLWGFSDIVSKNNDVTLGVLKAIEKATMFIDEHPDESAQIIANRLGQDESVVKTIMSENIYRMNIDQEMVEDMRATIRYMVEAGIAEKELDPTNIILDSPLRSINSEYVSWE